MKEFIKNRLQEEITKADKTEVQKFVIDSSELTKKVEKIIKDRLKNDAALEDKVVEITKNVITQLYKALWVKRAFWRGSLTNKSV